MLYIRPNIWLFVPRQMSTRKFYIGITDICDIESVVDQVVKATVPVFETYGKYYFPYDCRIT